MFSSILIANRGEIAVRIIAAARTLGIRTVAVYSEADVGALHVRLADMALPIGPANVRQSYLNIEAVVAAALESGAEAVHPGYGFLSENADFARAVTEAGLIFIGPDADAIATMSDKVAARKAAIVAGVPVLPGSDGAVSSADDAHAIAREIGYPIAVKASFGGGGRGIRVATNADDLEAAMAAAAREAGVAFGRPEIFLESFLMRPRHVEVQILGDRHGNVIHLGDRDCTVQRRHQKMIEEAPAPDLPVEMRSAMQAAAVALCRSVNYTGAGTVEFLVDRQSDRFAFLEMNTRLQVEHGVTELVTGVDLVEAQIRVAAGDALGIQQDDVRISGHAIQARISAEDCTDDFRPAPGRITDLSVPLAPWTRADFGVARGDSVQPHYDSMIGKLLAWGPDREKARIRLHGALGRLRIAGVPTTAPYAAAVLEEEDFRSVRHFTGSVEQDWAITLPPNTESAVGIEEDDVVTSRLTEREVKLAGAANRVVSVFGHAQPSPPRVSQSPRAARAGAAVGSGASATAGVVVSPMDGMVLQVLVAVGDTVERGATVLVLEAMKMEVVIAAPHGGVVRVLTCRPNEAVSKGQMLVEIEAV